MAFTMVTLTIPESLLLRLSPMKLGIGLRRRASSVGPWNQGLVPRLARLHAQGKLEPLLKMRYVPPAKRDHGAALRLALDADWTYPRPTLEMKFWIVNTRVSIG